MRLAGAVIGAVLIVSAPAAGAEGHRQAARQVNPTGAAVQLFQQRVAEYVKLHDEAEAKVPDLTETREPAKISGREAALGRTIQQMRAGAQPGDIFVKEFQPILLETVREDFATRAAADRRALVQELPKDMKLGVNMVYPTALPLATFPARLLRALPDLPPELEYRILGRHLILRDIKANIIVDYVPNAVPTLPS